MKNLMHLLGIISMFIGIMAFCLLDSNVPLWGTMLMVLVGFVGFFGGLALCYITHVKA